ncbi:MAG: hypothetical protein IPK16_18315 [Anaerolineales bacterium]|nr:hypothetical protein [Anaerolineales bacterium]
MNPTILIVAAGLWGLALLATFLWSRRHPAASPYWRDLLSGGVLFLLMLGFFWRTLSGDVFQPADGGDLVSFLFPTYRFAAAQLAQGQLPLWNPTLYGGAPFIGDIQAGFLYLPNLLLFLTNPAFAYPTLQWLSALHLFWAGLGMYALLRTLRWENVPVARLAALFGAVAFMFSDPLLLHFGNYNLIAVLSWLPWVMAAYVWALESGDLRLAALAGLLFAVSVYAGHAQSTIYIGLALVVYTAGWWASIVALRRRTPDAPKGGGVQWAYTGRPVLVFSVTVALAVLLAAPVLLPALELAQHSVRSEFTYQDATAYSLDPAQALVGLLTPGFFGRGPALHWSLWQRVELPYLGIAALIMALAAPFLAPVAVRRRLWPWLGMAVFGLVVALGVYGIVHGWLTMLLPIFDQLRAPARALILWALGAGVLAALGADQLVRSVAKHATGKRAWPYAFLRSPVALALVVGAFILFGVVLPLAYYSLLVTQADPTAFLRASVATLALVFAAVFWAITLAVAGAYRARWFGGVACLVLLTGLLYFDLSANGAYTDISPTDPAATFAHPEIIDFLRSDPDLFRIDTRTEIADLWQPDTAALIGLQDIGGVANPLALRSFEEYWQTLGGRDTPGYDLLNVKYVLVREGTPLPGSKFERVLGPVDGLEVYRNNEFVPRAWFASESADLANVAPAAEATAAPVTASGPNAFSVQLTAPADGLLVLSEIWYPGWQAHVNGLPATIEQVDGLFRAVRVPAGDVDVEFRYAPATFQWGLWAAGAGGVFLVIIFLLARRRKRVDGYHAAADFSAA